MRTLRLAQTAACAEGLRLRRAVRRMAMQAALMMVALGFLALGVGFAHVAVWLTLEPVYGAARVAMGLMLGDLAIACGLVLTVARMRPGRIEIEARAVGEQAWRGVRQSLDVWGLIVAVVRLCAARRADGPR